MIPKRQAVLNLLESKGTVTNIELNSVCFRYGARIHELREQGHWITTERREDGVWTFTLRSAS